MTIMQRADHEDLVDDSLDPRAHEEKRKLATGPMEKLVAISIDVNNPSKVLKLGKNLADKTRQAITSFLLKNLDVFAWSHEDIVGINLKVMCHRLNIDPNHQPVQQKRRPIDVE